MGDGSLRSDAEGVERTVRAEFARGETRLPASVAVLFAAAMHALLPNSLLVGPRFTIPAVELAMLVPLIAINPRRLTTETRWSRMVGLGLVLVIIAANLVALWFLLRDLTVAHIHDGRHLLLAALQIYLTNIIAFALVFWELDRGGAVARIDPSAAHTQPDFQFTRDGDPPAADGTQTWRPSFVDYLYLSITNSTAFSPTDTLPLTTRAKLLMSVEGLASLIMSLLVIARAVNILN